MPASFPPLAATFLILCTLSAARGEFVDFDRDVRPILADRCFVCHGPDAAERKADLRLDTREGLLGSDILSAGDSAASELFNRIASEDPDEVMPPADFGKSLSADEIRTIRRWIEQGAEWREHWAWRQAEHSSLPPVADSAWARNFVDRYILARLEKSGLRPAAAADSVTLVRRVYFDLTGLPPTPDDVSRYLGDDGPGRFERLVDGLLDSPAFGERMATHWLDLVRWADTVGYHGDQPMDAWLYRDWTIHAFNRNAGFDRMTRQQLAGDLLPDADVWDRVAAGYLRLHQMTAEGGAQSGEYLTKYMADRVRNVSSVWMGATLGCAECHDHKYDPFTAKDFYSFAAIFADIKQDGVYPSNTWGTHVRMPSPEQAAKIQRFDEGIRRLRGELKAAEAAAETAADPDAVEKAKAALADAEKKRTLFLRTVPRSITAVSVEPRTIRLLPRGDWLDQSGPVMSPAVPHFLPPLATDRRPTRLDFADWLLDVERGVGTQTARVFVNRLWQMLFGRGLAADPDDLGVQGARPTHPQLLDRLAVEFVDAGWDVKRILRTIVLSATYRQASDGGPEGLRIDPENRLFSRQARPRLDAESIRDQALLASGLLVRHIGGPSGRPYQPEGYYQYLNFPARRYEPSVGADQHRRGVYTWWQRTFLHPTLIAFDAPSREECVAKRPQSNTPLAALALLNDPSFVEAAKHLAARMVAGGGPDAAGRVEHGFRVVLSRTPDEAELRVLTDLYHREHAAWAEDPSGARRLLEIGQSSPPDGDPVELAAWTSVARALLNLDQTIVRY